jgi:hypothetical protein
MKIVNDYEKMLDGSPLMIVRLIHYYRGIFGGRLTGTCTATTTATHMRRIHKYEVQPYLQETPAPFWNSLQIRSQTEENMKQAPTSAMFRNYTIELLNFLVGSVYGSEQASKVKSRPRIRIKIVWNRNTASKRKRKIRKRHVAKKGRENSEKKKKVAKRSEITFVSFRFEGKGKKWKCNAGKLSKQIGPLVSLRSDKKL